MHIGGFLLYLALCSPPCRFTCIPDPSSTRDACILTLAFFEWPDRHAQTRAACVQQAASVYLVVPFAAKMKIAHRGQPRKRGKDGIGKGRYQRQSRHCLYQSSNRVWRLSSRRVEQALMVVEAAANIGAVLTRDLFHSLLLRCRPCTCTGVARPQLPGRGLVMHTVCIWRYKRALSTVAMSYSVGEKISVEAR